MNDFNPKINDINKTASTETGPTQKKAGVGKDGAFNKILANQAKAGSSDTVEHHRTALPEIETPFQTQKIRQTLNQSQLTQKLATSLDLFETYASWLGDPDKTLKQAHGILETVLSQTASLSLALNKDKADNTELKQLLTRLIATAEVEQVKFNRGDYI